MRSRNSVVNMGYSLSQSRSIPRSDRTSTPLNSAFSMILVSSRNSTAVAIQLAMASGCFLISTGRGPLRVISPNTIRPPGFSTRHASQKTRCLRMDMLTTPLEIMTSTLESGRGTSSMDPCRNSALLIFIKLAYSWALATISGVMSRPMALPFRPDSPGSEERVDPPTTS